MTSHDHKQHFVRFLKVCACVQDLPEHLLRLLEVSTDHNSTCASMESSCACTPPLCLQEGAAEEEKQGTPEEEKQDAGEEGEDTGEEGEEDSGEGGAEGVSSEEDAEKVHRGSILFASSYITQASFSCPLL